MIANNFVIVVVFQHQTFSYIQTILTSPHFSNEEKLRVQDEAAANLPVCKNIHVRYKHFKNILFRGK